VSGRAAPSAWLPRIAYRVLTWCLFPFLWLRLWWRGRHLPAYRERWRERLGYFAPPARRDGVWFHLVSAGETIAAAPLVRAFLAARPHVPVVVTTTTPTGSDRVRALLGDRVLHVYAPYDYKAAVARFLDRTQPRLLVLMETELWPQVLAACARRGIRVVAVNARLSARSARGYARAPALTRRMLAAIDHVACQFDAHRGRFLALGADPSRVSVVGSVKFDLDPPEGLAATVDALAAKWRRGRPTWLAGSTHDGEEDVVLAAHARVRARFPDALLVLVPRHPERCAPLRARIAPLASASVHDDAAAEVGVVLGDRMGDLFPLYGIADVAFVGGSLVDHGGQNVIEPAWHGLPVLTGPSDRNFTDVVARLEAAQALQRVTDAATLADAVITLLSDPSERSRRGAAARAVVDENRGATARLAALLLQHADATERLARLA
jgi:3-deoxy-D-manno-octulosonic-acid transferase